MALLNWKVFIVLLFISFLFNEFFIYYAFISLCKWPLQETSNINRAIILSDTHLLGIRLGHWFDKLRREWQMRRSFQTALQIHQPDVVFILGDLFDEGKWVTDDEEWKMYVERAEELFNSPNSPLYVVIGNHDVGFHNHMTEAKIKRFFDHYQKKHFELIELNFGVFFILVNSMSLQDDHCSICNQANEEFDELQNYFHCSLSKTHCKNGEIIKSRPILLQHFPLYRESDESCSGLDAARPEEIKPFVEGFDCVSKASSQKLLKNLSPRLVLSGHTHNGCEYKHEDGTVEISVPSFSWRNRNNPSFMMLSVSKDDWEITKCYLPTESLVFFIYFITAFITVLAFLLNNRRLNSFKTLLLNCSKLLKELLKVLFV